MTQRPLFAGLFKKHYAELQRYIAHKFSDADGADDIVQDAFHNLLRTDDLEAIENPRAYLYRSASNLALNRIRNQGYRNQHLQSLDDDEPMSVTLERQASAVADLQRVNQTLEQVPEKYRRTFLLSRVEGKTYQEISDELGIAVSTVEKHIIRVLQYLRDVLEEVDL